MFFKERHIDIYIYKLLMWGKGKRRTSQRGRAHRDWGGAGAAHNATQKQPHLTDEIITPRGWGRGGGHGRGRVGHGRGRKQGYKEEGPGPRTVRFLPLSPANLPTSAHHRSLGLPSVPSSLPLPSCLGLQLSSTGPCSRWQVGREDSKVQMQGPWVLS